MIPDKNVDDFLYPYAILKTSILLYLFEISLRLASKNLGFSTRRLHAFSFSLIQKGFSLNFHTSDV